MDGTKKQKECVFAVFPMEAGVGLSLLGVFTILQLAEQFASKASDCMRRISTGYS